MNSENLNHTLGQLESSLRELDSARHQVEKVTESSNKLTIATSVLVNDVKKIADKIADETTSIIAEFSEKLSDFDNKLKVNSKLSEKSIHNEIVKFSELTGELKQSSEDAITELKSLSVRTILEQEKGVTHRINTTLELLEKKTSSVVSDFTEKLSESQKTLNVIVDKSQRSIIKEVEQFRTSSNDLKVTAERAINEIKSQSSKIIKDQETETLEIIRSLSSYCTQLQSLIDKLAVSDIPSQLNKIDANISVTYNAIEKTQNQIENFQTNIVSKLIANSEEQTNLLTSTQKTLENSMSLLMDTIIAHAKKQQTTNYITWVIIFIIGFLSIYLASN